MTYFVDLAKESPTFARATCGNVTVSLSTNENGVMRMGVEIKRDVDHVIRYTVNSINDLATTEIGRRLTNEEAQRLRLALARLLVSTCPDAKTLR